MIDKRTEDLLILTKTYPSPSTRHRETTCVAALNQDGVMRRLFPVPFRFLDGERQFKKWEWIHANLIRAPDDSRPESYKIDVDTIMRLEMKIGTEDAWKERRDWIEPRVLESIAALEARRQATGQTLGFIRPKQLLSLEITEVRDPDWTDEDRTKLLQDGLFDSAEARKRPPLRKLPYDFHYNYKCETQQSEVVLRHKITDWEVGALYWRCRRDYGANWERFLREKLEVQFAKRDLIFLMGTIHRFPDQWLIVGLVYPPKVANDDASQLSFDLAP